jgi:hypothetical protein
VAEAVEFYRAQGVKPTPEQIRAFIAGKTASGAKK